MLNDVAESHIKYGDLNEAIKIHEQTLNYVAAGRYADAINLCDQTLAAQKVPTYKDDHLNVFPSVTELVRIKADAQKNRNGLPAKCQFTKTPPLSGIVTLLFTTWNFARAEI